MSLAGIEVPANAVPLVGVELSFTIVAVVSVGLRVLTRTWLIKHIGFDDLFIVLSAVSFPSPPVSTFNPRMAQPLTLPPVLVLVCDSWVLNISDRT